LDLYVTTTDLRGWPLPIALADGVTDENRYRTVFRFHHSTLGKPDEWLRDFKRDNNPFLAFAARATSAFPFAFRPASLADAKKLAGLVPYYKDITGAAQSWNNFYSEYVSKNDRFDLRSFGDGGALDNKPFSYITETLLRRQSDIPVDRRLFYIEPAPEHPKNNAPLNEPNFVENVLAQAVDLPRRETIREDLLQIKSRNDLIERTNNILRQVGATSKTISRIWKSGDSNKVDWQNKYLDEILPIYGVGYAAYHQLRVLDTLDNFAIALGRNLGIEENDNSFPALRQILEEWRKTKYSPNSINDEPKISENDLLYRMDLGWHVRRIHFVLRIIDDLLLGLEDFWPKPETAGTTTDPAHQTTSAQEWVMNSNPNHEKWIIADDAAEAKFSEVLSKIKHEINGAYTELKLRGRKLRRRGLALESHNRHYPKNLRNYARSIQVLQSSSHSLEEILKDPAQLETVCDEIESASLTLGTRAGPAKGSSMGYLHEIISKASHRCKTALTVNDEDDIALAKTSVQHRDPASNVQMCLKYYYQHFEYFDMLTFPIAYATPIGESDQMDVYRISPEDAKGLFIEDGKKHKLAGIKFANFGAFLRKEWRQNDILWGQLDAAERIIVTILPDVEDHKELLVRAWLTILDEKREYLGPKNLQKLEECLGSGWERFVQPEAYTSTTADELKEKLNKYFADYKPELKSGLFSKVALGIRLVVILLNLLMNLVTRYLISPLRSLILIALGAEALVMVGIVLTLLFISKSRLNWTLLGLDTLALLLTLSLLALIHYYKSDDPAPGDQGKQTPLSETAITRP